MDVFTKIFEFIFDVEKGVWQHIFWDSLLIPIVLFITKGLKSFYHFSRPINLLLKGFNTNNPDILLFLSQLSVLDSNGSRSANPRFVSSFPNPIPTNRNNIQDQLYQNIDPLWSEADGRSTAEVFNLLGRISKVSNVRIANTLADWESYNSPLFTIGFNPKTRSLMETCAPISFELNDQTGTLKIKGIPLELDARTPNDAGIIQKSIIQTSKVPVFMLAGLGTAGTESSGVILNKHSFDLGKLYGARPFCLLHKTDSRTKQFEVMAIYPNPTKTRMILYYQTYRKWKRKNVFSN